MKDFISDIKSIEAYLSGDLSTDSKAIFNARLNEEPAFTELFNDHSDLLIGIERAGLKKEITNARNSFESFNLIKTVAIAASVLATAIMCYLLFFQNESKAESSIENPKAESVLLKDSTDAETIDVRLDTLRGTLRTNLQNPHQIVFGDSVRIEKKEKFQILKEAQTFRLNTNRDTVINCLEGTQIQILKNSFVTKSGKEVSGTIQFKVSEYYKLSDIVLANLSTTSNGELLETGGMLFIEAVQNGQKLELYQGKSLDILFAGRKKDDGMKLFYGKSEQERINWMLSDKPKETKHVSSEEDIEVPFAVIEEIPRYPGCEELLKEEAKKCTSDAISKFVSEKFNVGIAANLGLEGTQRIMIIFKINKNGEILYVNSRGPHPLLEEEANTVIASMPNFIPGKQRGRAVTVPYSLPLLFRIEGEKATFFSQNFTRDFNVNIKDIPIDSIVTFVRGEVEKIREVMHDADFKVDSDYIKKWNEFEKQNLIRQFGSRNDKQVMLRKSLFEDAESRFKTLDSDSISRGGHIIRKVWDSTQIPTTTTIISLVPRKQVYLGTERMDMEEFEDILENDSISNQVGTYDLSRFAFKTTNLGWLNCDKFRMSRRNKFSFSIPVTEANSKADINMVYKSVKSVFAGYQQNGKHNFGLIGEDEEVILVAIKKHYGKLFLDMVETKTQRAPNIQIDLKEVSLEELKNKMTRLDQL